MNELADLVASKIVLELFGDAEARANAQEQFEKDFQPTTDHLAGIFADTVPVVFETKSPMEVSFEKFPVASDKYAVNVLDVNVPVTVNGIETLVPLNCVIENGELLIEPRVIDSPTAVWAVISTSSI